MAVGTDKVIFEKDEKLRTPTKGRPQINRSLVKRLLEAGHKPKAIAERMSCSPKSIRRIRTQLRESGQLTDNGAKVLDIVYQDFDEECTRATGISFYAWLKTNTSRYTTIFNFCRRVWANIWDRPSLVITKDSEYQLGDQLCIKFLETFGEDTKRIRARKKQIRYIFRFIGRHDLCDRHLTMRKSRDPIPTKRIPEISFPDFPMKLMEVFNRVEKELGFEGDLELRFKLCSQMRTGDKKTNKGLYGLKMGSQNPSYVIVNNGDYRCHVLEKKNEEWDITWLPLDVKERLIKHVEHMSEGESIFNIKSRIMNEVLKKHTLEVIGIPMTLHDLRKVGLTWLYVMGIPLEIATEINVGWKDMNTAKEHYLQMRNLLKKSEKEIYRAHIPDWYKDGLDEYTQN